MFLLEKYFHFFYNVEWENVGKGRFRERTVIRMRKEIIKKINKKRTE